MSRRVFGAGQLFSALINSWNVRGNHGPSDFDVRHVITGTRVALPFGRGAGLRFRRQTARWDTLIGGWTLSGLGIDQWAASALSTAWAGHQLGQPELQRLTGPVCHGRAQLQCRQSQRVQKNQTLLSPTHRLPIPERPAREIFCAAMAILSIDAGVSKVFRITERQNLKIAFSPF